MNEWFLYSIILIFSVSMSNLTLSYSKLSRVFYGYGKSIPESSVYGTAFQPHGSPPYFNVELIKRKSERYFASYLEEGEYSYELLFPNDKEVRSFTLSFKGDVSGLFVFSKNAKFYIREGSVYAS